MLIPAEGEMLELAAKECTRSDVFTGQEAYGEYTNVLNKIMEEMFPLPFYDGIFLF